MTVRQKRTNLNYTFTGLPPGTTTILVDELWRYETNNRWRALFKMVKKTDLGGTVRFDNLRDSIYSLLIINFDQTHKSIHHIQIGNPDLFQTISYHSIPSTVILLTATTGQEGATVYIDLTWKLPTNGIDGYYHIYVKEAITGNWKRALVINNPQQFYGRIEPLNYNTTYYFKIRSLNEDGKGSGYSNILFVTTPAQQPADITPPADVGWII